MRIVVKHYQIREGDFTGPETSIEHPGVSCTVLCSWEEVQTQNLGGALGTYIGDAGYPKGLESALGGGGRGLVSPRQSDGLNWVLGMNRSAPGRVKVQGL